MRLQKQAQDSENTLKASRIEAANASESPDIEIDTNLPPNSEKQSATTVGSVVDDRSVIPSSSMDQLRAQNTSSQASTTVDADNPTVSENSSQASSTVQLRTARSSVSVSLESEAEANPSSQSLKNGISIERDPQTQANVVGQALSQNVNALNSQANSNSDSSTNVTTSSIKPSSPVESLDASSPMQMEVGSSGRLTRSVSQISPQTVQVERMMREPSNRTPDLSGGKVPGLSNQSDLASAQRAQAVIANSRVVETGDIEQGEEAKTVNRQQETRLTPQQEARQEVKETRELIEMNEPTASPQLRAQAQGQDDGRDLAKFAANTAYERLATIGAYAYQAQSNAEARITTGSLVSTIS